MLPGQSLSEGVGGMELGPSCPCTLWPSSLNLLWNTVPGEVIVAPDLSGREQALDSRGVAVLLSGPLNGV